MILFIIPGGGDPEAHEYKAGFELLCDEAKKRSFIKTIILKFPGHFSLSGETGILNQNTATNIVLEKLLKIEELKIPYMVYARSYGCGVIMKVLLENQLSHLHRVVLWGPTPIVGIYKLTVHEKEAIELAKKKKGCYVSDETYKSCEPFEIQILKYNGKETIYIGAGTNDKLCKPVYFNFLSDYTPNRNISYTSISGLEHEVSLYDERYIQFVFGNISYDYVQKLNNPINIKNFKKIN